MPIRLPLLALACVCLSTPLAAQESTISAERRLEADGSTTLVHWLLVPAPRDEVWRAISTAEGWMEWAVPIAWSDPAARTLETSYNPADHPGDPGTIIQRIVMVVPGYLFGFRTIKAPASFPAAETYYRVSSVFELDDAPGGTEVRLTAVDFANSADGQQLADFFAHGNAVSLEHLRQRFISGPRDWAATTP